MSRLYRIGALSILLIGILCAAAPSSVNAEVALTPAEAANLREDVESYINDIPPNSSLLLCSDPARGTGDNIFSCGGLESQAGQLSDMTLVTWGAGDTVRCSYYARIGFESDAPACRIDRTNGITTYFYDYVGAAGGGYRIANFRGNEFVDGTSESGAGELVDEGTSGALGAVQNLAEDALTGIASLILQFSTLLLGWAGSLLNWVMLRGVFQFSQLIGNSPGLLLAWGILRDLGNILLLFGFIFIGVSTILGTSKFGDKKALPKLLIFAILMNFSLFAAEAVIDTANVLASTIYNQASIDSCDVIESGPAQLEGVAGGSVKECALEYGLAGHMIQSSGLASVYAAENPAVETATMVGLAAFITIGAVVIFAASFMLITRAITLTFLMITSPIGFAGMALPPMQKFAMQWWSKLLHQAFYAPILILMILISLKITDSFTSNLVGGRNLGAAIQTPTAASMGVLFIFALVIGFMIASIAAAKKFGIAGSDFAMNMVNKTARFPLRVGRGAAVGAARGTGSFVGRNTVGRASQWAQKRYSSAIANGSPQQQRILMGLGIDRSINRALEAGKSSKYGGSRSLVERQNEAKARQKELGEIARKEEKKRKIQTELNEQNKDIDGETPDQKKQRLQESNDRLAEVLDSMNAKELEELDLMKKSEADLQKIAESLSPEKFAALMKDGAQLSENKKEQMRELRFKDLNATVSAEETKIKEQEEKIKTSTNAAERDAARQRIAESKTIIRNSVKRYSSKDLENMSSNGIASNALLQSLTDDQRSDLLKSGKISASVKRKLQEYDPVEQIKAIHKNHGGAETAQAIKKMKLSAEQIAKLDTDILTSTAVVRNLNKKDLAAIAKRGVLDDADIKIIKDKVKQHSASEDAKKFVNENDFWKATT